LTKRGGISLKRGGNIVDIGGKTWYNAANIHQGVSREA
jgi:hypothetical protein